MNLLTKGSERHCEGQLRKTPELHFKEIAETIRYARARKLAVNVYLEDWSQGVRDSFDYVFATCRTWAGSACAASTCPTRSASSRPTTSRATSD